MKASEYINYLVNGETYKLAIQDVGDLSVNPSSTPSATQTTNRKKFISYLNLHYYIFLSTILFDKSNNFTLIIFFQQHYLK